MRSMRDAFRRRTLLRGWRMMSRHCMTASTRHCIRAFEVGHSPVRIQTSTPRRRYAWTCSTVRNLIDMLDATARELEGPGVASTASTHWTRRGEDKRNEYLKATLIACAGHPRLATFADAGFVEHRTSLTASPAKSMLRWTENPAGATPRYPDARQDDNRTAQHARPWRSPLGHCRPVGDMPGLRELWRWNSERRRGF